MNTRSILPSRRSADPSACSGSASVYRMNRSCVDVITATIKEAEQHFSCGVGLVIFDTYSKGVAAGGAMKIRLRIRTSCRRTCAEYSEVSFEPPSRFTSFDHLVGAAEQRRRDVKAERL